MVRTLKKRKSRASLIDGSVFRRLDLGRAECRTEVIREALTKQALLCQKAGGRWSPLRVDAQLSLLVWSAYRLLDPRYRTSSWDRVQLAYALDRMEEEIPVLEPLSILKPARPMPESTPSPTVRRSSRRRSGDHGEKVSVELVGLVEMAVAHQEVARQEIDADDNLERRRELVRLLRSEEVDTNEGWLTSLRRWFTGGKAGMLLLLFLLSAVRLPTWFIRLASTEPTSVQVHEAELPPELGNACDVADLNQVPPGSV